MGIKEFMLEEHADVVKSFCETENCRISFRRAGPDTVTRLKKGSPCKGHAITEKSIKDKTINKMEVRLEPWQAELLRGRIGHWNDDSCRELRGVYISQEAKKELSRMLDKGEAITGFWQLVLNAGNDTFVPICQELYDFLAQENCDQYFLTGDYDIHELFYKEAGHWMICPEEAAEEKLQKLNDMLMTVSRPSKMGGTTENNEFSFIRHGAQINYCVFTIEHESEKRMVYPVVTADHDVAFFDEKGQVVVCSEDPAGARHSYEAWYKNHYQVIKATFAGDYDAVLRQMIRNVDHQDIVAEAVYCLFCHRKLELDCGNAQKFLMALKGYVGNDNDLFNDQKIIDPCEFIKGKDPKWAAERAAQLYLQRTYDKTMDDYLYQQCYTYLLTFMTHNEIDAVCFDVLLKDEELFSAVKAVCCGNMDLDEELFRECAAMLESYYEQVKTEGSSNQRLYNLIGNDLVKWRTCYYQAIKAMAPAGVENEEFFESEYELGRIKGINEEGHFMKYGYCNIMYQLYKLLLSIAVSEMGMPDYDNKCTLILQAAMIGEKYVPNFRGKSTYDRELGVFEKTQDLPIWKAFYNCNTKEELVCDGSFFGNYRGNPNYGIGADGEFYGRELLHFLSRCYKYVYETIREVK